MVLRKCLVPNLIYFSRNLHQNKWNSVVGLEVHAQISSNSKLFSGAPTDFSGTVNNNVSLFDAAIPGTLPVLNKRCVETGVLTALSLSCSLNAVSYFDRKHYFYADLPAGYQITQQRLPLAINGGLNFPVYTPDVHKKPYNTRARVRQLQLEQDSGRSLHDALESCSLVDLNRAGIPLMEIVFEPDLTDGEEAAALVKELTLILTRLGSCSCKLEEGALRVDANVSVNRSGEPLGVRSEVKNIGSIRGVASAVKYEIERQIRILELGGVVTNETRSWDAQNKKTVAMRDKETVQDYRYMPEPNLPPLQLNMGQYSEHSDSYVNVCSLRERLPELPECTRHRLISEHGLTTQQALVLVNSGTLYRMFTETVDKTGLSAKIIVNLLVNDLMSLVNKLKMDLETLDFPIDHFREIIEMLQTKTINVTIARQLLEHIVQGTNESPRQLVERDKMGLMRDEDELRKLCETVIRDNSALVSGLLGGKGKMRGALLGRLSAASGGRADMTKAIVILDQLINDLRKK